MRLMQGVLFGGCYELQLCIVIGGMGEVWEVMDYVIGCIVVIKIFKDEYMGDFGFFECFCVEVWYVVFVNYEGIVSVFDYGEENGSVYFVMEFVFGEVLLIVFECDGVLSVDKMLDIVVQMVFVLQVVYVVGFVYCDIKLGNLLIMFDGCVKIIDFGIVCIVDQVLLIVIGQVMGIVQYFLFEQVLGYLVFFVIDIYLFGIVVYECFVGKCFFIGEFQVVIVMVQINEQLLLLLLMVLILVQNFVMVMIVKKLGDCLFFFVIVVCVVQVLCCGDLNFVVIVVFVIVIGGIVGDDDVICMFMFFGVDGMMCIFFIMVQFLVGEVVFVEEEKKKKKCSFWMWLLIVLIVLFVIVFGGVFLVFLNQGGNDDEFMVMLLVMIVSWIFLNILILELIFEVIRVNVSVLNFVGMDCGMVMIMFQNVGFVNSEIICFEGDFVFLDVEVGMVYNVVLQGNVEMMMLIIFMIYVVCVVILMLIDVFIIMGDLVVGSMVMIFWGIGFMCFSGMMFFGYVVLVQNGMFVLGGLNFQLIQCNMQIKVVDVLGQQLFVIYQGMCLGGDQCIFVVLLVFLVLIIVVFDFGDGEVDIEG